MNNRFLNIFTIIASSTLFLAGCDSDNSSFETPNTGIATNPGIISQNNFSLLTADVAPAVIDATTGIFTKTDVELTVYIGDRNNQTLTDSHTVYFVAEYGLIEPSCVTKEGECSVMWSAIKRPEVGGPGSDGYVSITAYTIGEEGFSDTNGNSVFDDADLGFDDIEEPYVDADESNSFTAGDIIIDAVNTFDPTGANQNHDIADGMFNGPGCKHTTLCGTPSVMIFDDVTMSIVANQIISRTIGGSVTGLTGSGLVLQNNGGDNLTITADGGYTFTTPIDDGSTYNVSVSTQPTAPAQVCSVTNNTGTVSANVTNADVTCVTTTYTIGGSVVGLAGSGLVLQNNLGDDYAVAADGSFTFATPINDSSTYDVTVLTQPTVPGQVCTPTSATGTATADVSNVTITCVTNTHTIGGTISFTSPGQTIVIQNNLGDDLTLTNADTNFVFATPIADGSTYDVTELTPPAAGSCAFTNSSGTVLSADVTNVDIVCP